MTAKDLVRELTKLKNPNRSKGESRFFKTGPGEYGEGDIFWGVPTANKRKLAREYKDLPLSEIKKLLTSPIHDQRVVALVILTIKYPKATPQEQKQIYHFYLNHTKHINNWDLVDISAPQIIGTYLLDKNRSILYKLARSKSLWERRISVLATFAFIRNNDFTDALKISKILLTDQHDLIHKATGWMLREMGKKDQKLLEDFLNKYTLKMPRTMLRYGIEKFSEDKRQYYLKLGK